MLDVIREKESISDEYGIQIIGSLERDDHLYLCVVATHGVYEDKFYIQHFKADMQGDQYCDGSEMLDRGFEIAMDAVGGEYWFAIANTEVETLFIEYVDGRTITIPVEEYPFFYAAEIVALVEGKSYYYPDYQIVNSNGLVIAQR